MLLENVIKLEKLQDLMELCNKDKTIKEIMVIQNSMAQYGKEKFVLTLKLVLMVFHSMPMI